MQRIITNHASAAPKVAGSPGPESSFPISPGPVGPPCQPGLLRGPNTSNNPSKDRLDALKRCLQCIFNYLIISTDEVPGDAFIYFKYLFGHVSILVADGQQDEAEIEALVESSARQTEPSPLYKLT